MISVAGSSAQIKATEKVNLMNGIVASYYSPQGFLLFTKSYMDVVVAEREEGTVSFCKVNDFIKKDANWTQVEKVNWVAQSAYFYLETKGSEANFRAVNPERITWKPGNFASFDRVHCILASGFLIVEQDGCLFAAHLFSEKKQCLSPHDQWEEVSIEKNGSITGYRREEEQKIRVTWDSQFRQIEEKKEGQFSLKSVERTFQQALEHASSTPLSMQNLDATISSYLHQILKNVLDSMESCPDKYFPVSSLVDVFKNELPDLDLAEKQVKDIAIVIKQLGELKKLEKINILNNNVLLLRSADKFALLRSGKLSSWVKVGAWQITAFKELSNGLLAFATDSRGAQFVIYHYDEINITEIYREKTYKDNSAIRIDELLSGRLVLSTESCVWVYNPLRKNSFFEESIEKLERLIREKEAEMCLHINYLANQENVIEFYSRKTAYLSLNENETFPEDQLNVYFSAIKPALTTGDFYLAREFFNRGKRLISEISPQKYLYFINLFDQYGNVNEALNLRLEGYYATKDKSLLSGIPVKKRCKSRLFVGEGGFSYTQALLKKHEHTHALLPKSICATEIRRPLASERERITQLKALGVKILHGIDATQLETYFSGKRFQRIHWNFPYKEKLKGPDCPNLMEDFFRSASGLQVTGDRIHVTLSEAQELEVERNPIARASIEHYRLIGKRRFNEKRYPGYTPVKSEKGENLYGYQNGHEFVFEKRSSLLGITDIEMSQESEKMEEQSEEQEVLLNLMNRYEKHYDIKEIKGTSCYECSTDEESSDYYSSGEEEDGPWF